VHAGTFKPFDGVAVSRCIGSPSVAPDGSILVAQTGYERDPAIVIHNLKTGRNTWQDLSRITGPQRLR